MAQDWRIVRSGLVDCDFERLADRISVDLDGRVLFLTGATGFFGLWQMELFDWLHRTRGQRFEVHALTRAPDRLIERHPDYAGRPWLQLLQGDIRSFMPPKIDADFIIHGATETSAEAGRNPSELLDAIYVGTRRVLDFARAGKGRRVLVVSSGAIYGHAVGAAPLTELCTSAPDTMSPACAYGEGKRLAEALGTFAGTNGTVDVVTARCFAFLGAGLPLNKHFAVGNFIADAINSRKIVLKSTGRSLRSYLYAADLAVWLLKLAVDGRRGLAYNVGSDKPLTVHQTACAVRDVLAPGLGVEIAEGATDAANTYLPSIERARRDLDLDVWTDFQTALRRTAEDARVFGPYVDMTG